MNQILCFKQTKVNTSWLALAKGWNFCGTNFGCWQVKRLRTLRNVFAISSLNVVFHNGQIWKLKDLIHDSQIRFWYLKSTFKTIVTKLLYYHSLFRPHWAAVKPLKQLNKSKILWIFKDFWQIPWQLDQRKFLPLLVHDLKRKHTIQQERTHFLINILLMM